MKNIGEKNIGIKHLIHIAILKINQNFDTYEKELIDACKVFQIKPDNIDRNLYKSQYNKLALMNHPYIKVWNLIVD